ncbi:MAG: sugar phosphate nucleotidyltransferase [Chthoniobacterales bacterium]
MLIKKAFVLGAGLGTRLRPLTEDTPKPLIPIFQKPLITFALDHLIAAGVSSFVINIHKLADRFNERFGIGEYAGCAVSLVHEPVLLETGGGIKNAEPLLNDETFITYSGDILSDLNLRALIEEHFQAENDVTLALRNTSLSSGVAFQNGRVIDIARKLGHTGTHDFANVAIWNSAIFDRLPAGQKMSFVPALVDWIREGGRIGGLVLNDGKWFNIGSPSDYLAVHQAILREKWRPHFVTDSQWPVRTHPTATVDGQVELLGCTVIAENCRVGAGAMLKDTILWPGAEIASRSQLSSCILRSHQKASGFHHDHVF